MAHEARVPLEPVMKAMRMLARGLYQAYIGQALDADTRIEVKRYYDSSELKQTIGPLVAAGQMKIQQIGDGSVFTCVYGYAPSSPKSSIWVLVFYERAVFTILTTPRDEPDGLHG